MWANVLKNLVIFALGALIMHLWARFKNRTSLLKYTVWHQYLGGSLENSPFGSVKLLYNDRPMESLYMSTVTLSNASNKDLANLEVNVKCDPNSAIMISRAITKASQNELEFTEKYKAVIDEKDVQKAHLIFGRRDYSVPVLNRQDSVEVSLLITNIKRLQPVIKVDCDHPGVGMTFAAPQPEIWGESISQSAVLGTLIALGSLFPILRYVDNLVAAVVLALCLGLFATPIGLVLCKVGRMVIKLLS
jgi:hypothetical protein